MIDRGVEQLVDRAVAGKPLDRNDALHLLQLDTRSPEAAYVRWAADAIGREASGGVGQIYAQIGVDANPCPANCAFCTLAARNSAWKGRAEVPIDEVAGYAAAFDSAGAHLISLMSTAGFPFERFLDVVAAVRAAVSPDMPLMANVGDVNASQAQALKQAGVQAFYHAHRLGEGEITRIDPARRAATFDAVRNAGLLLMSAVEPVHAGTPDTDIVERMFQVIALKPYCAGVGSLTVVPGTALADCTPVSRDRTAFLAAVMRLAAGRDIPFGCGAGNVVWADAGTNPRGRTLPTDHGVLERDVARLRKELIGHEWTIPSRPLPSWFNGKTQRNDNEGESHV